MHAVNPVLAAKLGLNAAKPDPAQESAAATPMRQMRRALARAADQAVGLSALVLGIAEEELDAEDLIESGPDGWVVLGLRDGSNPGLTGLFLIDPALRSSLIEMQTMGNLLANTPDQRAVTRTDAVMSMPFADRLLIELAEAGFGGKELDPTAYDMGPMDDLRTAGLVMTQGGYRSWRITIQMGGGDAQGEILIAMRIMKAPETAKSDTAPGWSASLRSAVETAPAELDAVLCRLSLAINTVEKFEVGQVLHLAGTTVGSVMLRGPDGRDIANAKLGQVAGKRAVRVQPLNMELQDDPPKIRGGAGADDKTNEPRTPAAASAGRPADVTASSLPDVETNVEKTADAGLDANIATPDAAPAEIAPTDLAAS